MQLSEDIIYFWMSLSGIGSRRANKLLSHYSPYEIWETVGASTIDKSLFGDKAETLARYRNEDFLSKALDKLDGMGISFVTRNKFPECLLQSEVDPPVMLYYRGDVSVMNSDCVAVVGTRACSTYGKEVATRLSVDLCEHGFTIVSGLATGIDAYAHAAALKAGGKTVAVLGSGLNCVTPASNIGLYDKIIESGGLILSEYPPQYSASKYTFPERNRIVSGLSLGVVVVEAGIKSGALITAEFAESQGRTVFAVPGNITSSKSMGSNKLIVDGAVPVLSAQDVYYNLGYDFDKSEKNSRVIQLDIFEQKIYNILQSGDCGFDELVYKSEIAPQKLAAMLSSLEIKGAIKKKQSNTFGLA